MLLDHFHSSDHLSFCHVPVLCPDEWRYDRAVFSLW